MRLNNFVNINNRKKVKASFYKAMVIIFIISILAIFIAVFASAAWISRSLPSPLKIKRTKGFSTTFYDRNGKIIYQLYHDQNRIPVKFENISLYVKQATVSIEDKNFYNHKGFSSLGFLRAFVKTIFFGQVQGGSTLTQQLVKNTLLTSERTLIRKIKELFLSAEIERRYTKNEILEMYLNEAPYGGTFIGIESAAKGYFNISAKDLNLAQSAFLAGLPQSPSKYSPYVSLNKSYLNRSKDVLRRMREDNYITKEQEKSAYSEILHMKFEKKREIFTGSHFIFYVRDEIEKKWGPKLLDEGIEVYTTLSLDMQKKAEDFVYKEITTIKDKYNASNSALVAVDVKEGDILTMVGSYDYNDSSYGKYNAAISLRQPGSTVKPITYAVGLEKGYTASHVFMDVKTEFALKNSQSYIPVNYDNKYRGPIQFRFALGNSINVPAVKLLASVGLQNMMQKAYEMGIVEFKPTQENLNKFGLSLTLGGGEARLLDLTNAFAVFARGGSYKPTRSILKIKSYDGKTLFNAKSFSEKKVFSKEVSFIISHILSDNNARKDVFGENSYLVIPGKTVAVKTGTTDDKRDNWTIGYTTALSIGVWVGNNDNSPMKNIASGVTGASPIWHKMMKYSLTLYNDGIINKPDTVEAIEIDSLMGGLPKDGYPKRTEYFIKGTAPNSVSPHYRVLKLSKQNNKLANEFEIKSGNFYEKEFVIIEEEDPISSDGLNRWQKAIDEWRNQQEHDIYKYPTEVSDFQSDEIVVTIKEPSDKQKIDSNRVTIKGNIVSVAPVNLVEIYIDNNKLKTFTEDKKHVEELFELSDGLHIIKIRAENDKGKSSESEVRVGIKQDWTDATPNPTNTSTPTPPFNSSQ